MNKALITVVFILVISFCSSQSISAQEKSPGGNSCPCPAECKMFKGAVIRAADWVNAWQSAKEACTNANGLAIQLVDRSGPSFQAMKVFECVDLKASGELLIITVKKADKQEESVIIIRSSDMLRIEVTKRASAQD